MRKQFEWIEMGNYTVNVSLVNGEFRVEVGGIGADGKDIEVENHVELTQISDSVGWIVMRDVWEKEEAFQEAREAQYRLDHPELYEDEEEINAVFEQPVVVLEATDEDIEDEEYWLARTNGDWASQPNYTDQPFD